MAFFRWEIFEQRAVFNGMLKILRELLSLIFPRQTRFLCDSCKYDYGNACRRPERPNATKCPDYKKAGPSWNIFLGRPPSANSSTADSARSRERVARSDGRDFLRKYPA